ncbi:MAG TPA: TadE/TadG family type IV pilus assembly protein [Xanthobacteraceae bacterium]|jgi:Flp pilus assembly protein TadG|nr:TadE/TadG family type IV pilus assembly protein [Xanthobacteraceae bacterium]
MTGTISSVPLLQRLRDFARGQNGMAAVEFAVTLPFLLTAYLGGVELGDGVAIDRKVAITTRAVADLASRYTTIYNSDMSSILGASSSIIAPYSGAPLAVTVSEVTVDAKGNATVTWSDTLNGTAHAVGTPVTLPGTLGTATGTPFSYIWGEVRYAYTPTLGYVLTGTLNLSNEIFMSPRQSVSVTRVNS